MDRTRFAKWLALGGASLTLFAGAAMAAPISPTYDSFAALTAPELALINFGGTGISNAGPVALSSFASIATSPTSPTVYLALSATPRVVQSPAFTGPPLADNGAGTYFAQPVASPPSGGNNAGWNFNYAVIGDTRGLTFQFLMDPLPGAGTDEAQHADAAPLFITPFVGSGQSSQGSQNLGFGAAFPSFDPLVPGEYTFAIRAFNNSTLVDEVAIRVSVVPEPEAYGLAFAGMGVVGFAMLRRGRAGRQATVD